MDRRTFLQASATAAALTLLPRPLIAWQQSAVDQLGENYRKTPLNVTPVRERAKLFMVSGIGGNIAVLANSGEALLIDAGSHLRTDELLAKVKELGCPKVGTLINTHWHFDHTDGNRNLAHAGASIIAQENTKKRLSSDTKMEIFGITFPAAPPDALPATTFGEASTVEHGNERLHLTWVPNAHTDSDAYVHFEHADVIHTGDLVFNGFYPLIDYSTNGWIGGQAAGAQKVADLAKSSTKIIPGHGPLADKQTVQNFSDMLKRVHERLDTFMNQGKSVADVVAAKPTRDLDEQWGKAMFNGDKFTQMAYTGLLRHHNKPVA